MTKKFNKILAVSAVSILAFPLLTSAKNVDNIAAKPQEIVISASRIEMAREASGSAISVLNSDYLEQNQTRVVSDVLRDIPGVAVNRGGGVGGLTQVRIRGAEANQTLVLIDGIEVNDIANGSQFDFENLLNLDVERVEVLRGAQSALWGSDAMGGVINIVTKKGRGKLNGKISIEGGKIFGNGSSSNQETVNLNGGSDVYNYALNASFLNDKGISIASERLGNTEKDGYSNNSYNFTGGVKPLDILSFDMALRYVKSNSDTDGFVGGIGSVDDNSFARSDKYFAKVSAKLDLLDGNWIHKLNLSGNNTKNKFFTNHALTFLSKGRKKKAEYQTDYFLHEKDIEHRFTFATEQEYLDFYSKSVSSYGTSIIDRDTHSSGYVLEYGANFNNRVYTTVSGRRDLNDDFKNTTTYRLTISGWTNDKLRLHASKGTGIKNPDFLELYGFTSTYVGNAALKPEKNTTWDAGAEYNYDSVEGYVDLTYFNTEINELIVGYGKTANNLSSLASVRGVELSTKVEPSKHFRFNASYTFTDSDDGAGHQLVRRARHIASLNSSYLFPNEKTRLTWGVQYNGKQLDTKFDAFFNRTQVSLASYALVNIALEHNYSKTLKVFGRIDNLTDKTYQEVLTNGSMGVSAVIGATVKGIF